MLGEVHIVTQQKQPYRAALRLCQRDDARQILGAWLPLLERGPSTWLDREWRWDALDRVDLFSTKSPEWLVVADEIEPGAQRDILGVLVTTGPVLPAEHRGLEAMGALPVVWVEYIAIAPGLRPDCPAGDQRSVILLGIGLQLMRAAIERSRALGCDGRIGLHAEGEVAQRTYPKWKMQQLPNAPHPAGGSYPVYYGNREWSLEFGATPRKDGPK